MSQHIAINDEEMGLGEEKQQLFSHHSSATTLTSTEIGEGQQELPNPTTATTQAIITAGQQTQAAQAQQPVQQNAAAQPIALPALQAVIPPAQPQQMPQQPINKKTKIELGIYSFCIATSTVLTTLGSYNLCEHPESYGQYETNMLQAMTAIGASGIIINSYALSNAWKKAKDPNYQSIVSRAIRAITRGLGFFRPQVQQQVQQQGMGAQQHVVQQPHARRGCTIL